jgi:ABC-type amino acid transport substrate-binding protein
MWISTDAGWKLNGGRSPGTRPDTGSARSRRKIAQEIVTSELYGIPFAPDNDALREAVNEALTELKDDGTITELYEQYFPGLEPPEEVLEGTNEQLK